MAATVTYDAKQGTNKKMGAGMARGKKRIAAELNFSGQTYATGGITASFVGYSTLDSVVIEPYEGWNLWYKNSTGKVIADGMASDTNLGSWTAVKALTSGD